MGRGDQTRILAVVLAGFILRLWRLGAESLSTDEGRTWTAATSSLPRMIELAATRDGSPPLFHLLTSLVLRLVDDESGLRLVSVLASTGLIVLTYRLARLATDRRGATVAAAVTALSPFQLQTAQDARAHATVAFFTVLSLYLFARAALLGRARAWLPCVVATVLALYTHGLALLGVAVQTLAIASSRAARLRSMTWALAMGAVFVAYLPWLVTSVTQPSGLDGGQGAIRPPDRSIVSTLGQAVLALALALPLLASLRRLRDPGDRGRIARFALIALLLPLAVVLAATFRTPQWQPGHLVLLTPMLGVLVALGLETLRPQWLGVAWTALVMLACGNADFRYFVDYTKERWRDVAKRVAAESDPDSTAVIITFEPDAFEFYNAQLAKSFRVVPYAHADVPFHDAWTLKQYGAMYRKAVDTTMGSSDVWVIGRSPNSPPRKKATLMAETVGSFGRLKIVRDSLDSDQGALRYSHWRDRVDGATMRRSVVEGLAYAESVMANPPPPPDPITTPFTAAELVVDRDTVAFYIRRLGDRGFIEIYEHDGDKRTWYTAAERLGSLGAPAIQALMGRLESGDEYEKMLAVYALLLATQDPRVMARTGGEYVNPGLVLEGSNVGAGARIARDWWARHGHFWGAVPSGAGVSAPAPAAAYDTLRPAPSRSRRRRGKSKSRAKPSRVTRRRTKSPVPVQPPPTPEASCEGLLLAVGTPEIEPGRALELARAVVKPLRGVWSVRALSAESRTFRVMPSDRALPLADAWSLARALTSHRDVDYAEPALAVPGLEPPPALARALRGRGSIRARSGVADRHRPGSEAYDWNLQLCGVPEAKRAFESLEPRRRPGEGILIGHPDTGYTRHPEIWSADPQHRRIRERDGYDFQDEDADAIDPLEPGNPGHGTSTASIIMSDDLPGSAPRVDGVAPFAELVPLRVSTSVIHMSYAKLIEALYYAADHGHHVVSMSLGGPLPNRTLREALRYGVARGVIHVSAAGNVWPWVVYPGRYDEVVAVAATHCDDGIWKHSASGPEVDLSAPGESVWSARIHDGAFDVARGSGTSLATAMTAGTAALWLSYHGRAELIRRYGRANLFAVFKDLLLRFGVQTPAGWKRDRHGAGRLDVAALLAAPLPDSAPAGGARAVRASRVARRSNVSDEVASFFPDQEVEIVRRGLASLLGTDARGLEVELHDLGDEVAFHATLNPVFRAEVLRGGRRARVARGGTPSRLRADARFTAEASRELKRRVRSR